MGALVRILDNLVTADVIVSVQGGVAAVGVLVAVLNEEVAVIVDSSGGGTRFVVIDHITKVSLAASTVNDRTVDQIIGDPFWDEEST